MADERAFEGRIALVTGASRGIGAATAQTLAAAGAHVVLTARKAKDLEAVEEAIHQAGGTATIAPMDLTESDSISRLANAISERWDRLDQPGAYLRTCVVNGARRSGRRLRRERDRVETPAPAMLEAREMLDALGHLRPTWRAEYETPNSRAMRTATRRRTRCARS